MSTLTQQAALAADPQFQARVGAAVAAAAVAVAGEDIGSLDVPAYILRNKLAAAVLDGAPGAYAAEFAYIIAATTLIGADIVPPVLIDSTAAGLPAVIVTQTAHGLATGETVEITGADDPAVNGTWVATVTDTMTFTIPAVGSAYESEGGTVTQQPPDTDIVTAIAAVWDAVAGINFRT